MVFLKQFRDCVDPLGACYQSIVEGQRDGQDFKGGILAERLDAAAPAVR